MKMSDFFNLPMDVGSSSNDNNVGTACTELADNDFYLADFHRENTLEEAHSMAKAAAYAIDHHDALVAMNKELIKMSSSISQMCVGELTMGCRLDPQTIGEYIYSVTSMNSEELTAKAKELSHER